MTLKMILIGVGSLAIISCNTSEKSNFSRNDVNGVYVREYAIDVTHPETSKNIGMRNIRDTIFVEHADNNYLISNRKWRRMIMIRKVGLVRNMRKKVCLSVKIVTI